MLSELWRRYKAPTPAKWRKIGDVLLLVGASLTEYMLNHENHELAQLALLCTVIGKIITNLAEDQTPPPAEP